MNAAPPPPDPRHPSQQDYSGRVQPVTPPFMVVIFIVVPVYAYAWCRDRWPEWSSFAVWTPDDRRRMWTAVRYIAWWGGLFQMAIVWGNLAFGTLTPFAAGVNTIIYVCLVRPLHRYAKLRQKHYAGSS